MDNAETSAIERIARVLAGQRVSANAEGDDPSAGSVVDDRWREHQDAAISILKTLREPDAGMAAAGDAGAWKRMIAAALGEDAPGGADDSVRWEPPEPGTDPLHEGP